MVERVYRKAYGNQREPRNEQHFKSFTPNGPNAKLRDIEKDISESRTTLEHLEEEKNNLLKLLLKINNQLSEKLQQQHRYWKPPQLQHRHRQPSPMLAVPATAKGESCNCWLTTEVHID